MTDRSTGFPFACKRRMHEAGPWASEAGLDYWTERNTCSFCGSMHPDDFMEQVRAGAPITPTDKPYKAYAPAGKFYYQHLSGEQMAEFVDLYNAKKIAWEAPGYAYVLPFFMVALEDAPA